MMPVGSPADIVAVTIGGVYVRTGATSQVSYDDGESWQSVPTPVAGAELVAVDPTDDAALYFRTPDGLYATFDAGGSWALLLPGRAPVQLAVSPADGQLLYAVQFPSPTSMRFSRSLDRGATWSLLAEERQSLCVYRVFVLAAHPTEVSTVFRTLGCVSGRTTSAALQVSHDMGEHWPERFQPPGLFVRALVGGRGAEPGRFYLAANNTLISGAATAGALYRSDDNAASWNVLTPLPTPADTGAAVSALTYDSVAPDNVYAAVLGASAEVRVSCDAGTTWESKNWGDVGEISSLALSADSAFLFAGTPGGLWRVAVPRCAPPVN